MKFYFDKANGETKRLTEKEVQQHLSKYQISEAKQAKKQTQTKK